MTTLYRSRRRVRAACATAKPAIVVYGKRVGTTRTVCTDNNCPVHDPRATARQVADPAPTRTKQETEEEAEEKKQRYEEQQSECAEMQERRAEERRQEEEQRKQE